MVAANKPHKLPFREHMEWRMRGIADGYPNLEEMLGLMELLESMPPKRNRISGKWEWPPPKSH